MWTLPSSVWDKVPVSTWRTLITHDNEGMSSCDKMLNDFALKKVVIQVLNVLMIVINLFVTYILSFIKVLKIVYYE